MAHSSSLPSTEDTQAVASAPARPLAFRRSRWFFGVLLALSLGLLVLSLIAQWTVDGRTPAPLGPESVQESSLPLNITLATAIASLIGLLSTNLLAWRREARDAQSARLQIERQQLEIEKLRLELEKQRREM